jgi:hypothetical protein
MITACIIILSCMNGSIFENGNKRPAYACAINSQEVISVRYWDKGVYRLALKNKEVEHIKETPSQVKEKVNNCKR